LRIPEGPMLPNNDHAPAPGAEASDGRAGLSDRVRSLRLGERSGDKRGSRAGFIPWAASALLLLTTIVFGVKAFRAPPVAPEGPEPAARSGSAGYGDAASVGK